MDIIARASLLILTCIIVVQAFCFIRNYVVIRVTGLPRILSLVSPFQPVWLMLRNLFGSRVEFLPGLLDTRAHPFADLTHFWQHAHAAFQRVGSDTFAHVSPTGAIVWTCDPDVISQVLSSSRKGAFQKDPSTLDIVNVYGRSVAGTNGVEHRFHKNAVAPIFSERTYERVWSQTINRSTQLLDDWVGGKIPNVVEDIADAALDVMSAVCFERSSAYSAQDSIRLGTVLRAMVSQVQTILAFPRALLRFWPSRKLRRAYQAYIDWGKMMQTMVTNEKMAMVNEAMIDTASLKNPSVMRCLLKVDVPNESVLGNMFTLLIAGHETTANTLTYCILLLALHPIIQEDLYSTLKAKLGDRPPETWSLQDDYPALLDGLLGAVLNESLRLWPAVHILPYVAFGEQRLRSNGKDVLIPNGTPVFINITAAQRHPRFWPQEKESKYRLDDRKEHLLKSFDPYTWLQDKHEVHAGSFLPFGQGSRTCLGRRFAMVEMVAAITRIFIEYRVEIDASEWDVPPEVQNNLDDAHKSCARLARQMTEVNFTMTLKLSKPIALRLEKRSSQ